MLPQKAVGNSGVSLLSFSGFIIYAQVMRVYKNQDLMGGGAAYSCGILERRPGKKRIGEKM